MSATDKPGDRTSDATEVVGDLLKTAEEYMGEFESPMDRGVCYAMLVHLQKRAYTLGFLRPNSAQDDAPGEGRYAERAHRDGKLVKAEPVRTTSSTTCKHCSCNTFSSNEETDGATYWTCSHCKERRDPRPSDAPADYRPSFVVCQCPCGGAAHTRRATPDERAVAAMQRERDELFGARTDYAPVLKEMAEAFKSFDDAIAYAQRMYHNYQEWTDEELDPIQAARERFYKAFVSTQKRSDGT